MAMKKKMRTKKTSETRVGRAAPISKEIQTICESLTALGRALEQLGSAASAEPRVRQKAKVRVARAPKRKLTADRLAALRVQGEYIGQLRNLKPRQKAQVKALRAAKGVKAAIGLAKKLGKR
jgi:hypothetical protein